jgi:polyisoprenoid-binding protein YceI
VGTLIVLVVGGPLVYIHFIQGSPPPKFSLSTTLTTTRSGGAASRADSSTTAGAGAAGASATSFTGHWTIAPGSEVGYRVGEILFGQHNTAVGRTKDVTGQLTVAGTTVTSASFTVDMATVKSDESQRDAQFQGRIMDTATYPTATFRLNKSIVFGSLSLATVRDVTAVGQLTLRGKTEPVDILLQVERTGAPTVAVLGSVNIVFAKWSIPNPSFAGLVTTNDHGILEFLLSFEKGTEPATTTTPASAAPATSHPSGGPGGPGGPPPGGGGGFSPPTVPKTTVPVLTLPRGR